MFDRPLGIECMDQPLTVRACHQVHEQRPLGLQPLGNGFARMSDGLHRLDRSFERRAPAAQFLKRSVDHRRIRVHGNLACPAGFQLYRQYSLRGSQSRLTRLTFPHPVQNAQFMRLGYRQVAARADDLDGVL